jgi:DNA-binding CsgD family transcriptional regulator
VTAASAHGLGRASVAHETFELAHSIIERESIRTTYETISREHLDALAVAVLGETVSTSVARPSTSDAGVLLARLTRRERQVLVMLLSDRPMAAIARELFISPNTLKGTTRRLYRKLCVSSRAAAAEVAHRAGVHAEEGVTAVTPVPRVPSRLDPRE